MKQSNHNAVDLLLRSLARRERDESRADQKSFRDELPGTPAASDHLDADELNLYAEGVLPEPARARYAEHLADCGSCRRIVVGLAQAAGTIARHEASRQQSGVGFWQSFVALFSLPVLRYALPALLLAGVIAISLIALRERKLTGLVARNQQDESPVALNKPRQSETPASAQGSGSFDTRSSATSLPRKEGATATTDSNELKSNPVEKSGLLEKSLDTNTSAKPAAPPTAKDAREYSQVGGATSSQPVFAPEPAPPKAGLSKADTKSSVAKEESGEREAQKQMEDGFKVQSKDDSPTHGPSRSQVQSARGRLDAGQATENRAVRDKAKDAEGDESETRTVSGRRFRKQGNAWIDTAYESSHATTNVKRNSEQFRALLADEPGLRAIAQQLGGEVVVVWKNRAYRIR
jgi:putative zinc finger protein